MSYSAVVGAPPYSHYWFILLERMRVGSTASMVLDQVVWRPLTIAWSFIVGAVLADGSLVVRPAPHSRQPSAAGLLRWLTGASCVRCCRRPQNLRANLKKDYKKAVLNGLVLWVPLQYINFRYVPMRWRVLFIDVVHFFWCALACRPCAALALLSPALVARSASLERCARAGTSTCAC